ncbi:MAG: Diguanylate cyclase with sensor [Modestobacter sp.]|nr:Diguanylate cyclase with sensor [Modestobacter sp.]
MSGTPGPAPSRSAAELSLALVGATDSLICVVDGAGRILLVNPALERFTGRPATDLRERVLWDVLVVPEERALARVAVADAVVGGSLIPAEVEWLAAGDVRRRVALHTSVLADGDGRPYATAFVGADVTEQREREALSHRQASTDPLTGVYNRRVVFAGLQQHLDAEKGDGCGLLFCDVDQFKSVNDRHGHAAGDQLLVELAARLQRLSGPDDIVARLGGDEFVLLTPGTDPAALQGLARRITRGMREPVQTSVGPVSVGVSVGSATGRTGDDPDELMARADRDMYGSKTRRRRTRPRTPQVTVRIPG